MHEVTLPDSRAILCMFIYFEGYSIIVGLNTSGKHCRVKLKHILIGLSLLYYL